MSTVEWLRRSSEKRGVCWCAQFDERSPPFIGERVTVGAAAKSTGSRRFRRAVGLGEGATVFSSSRRICRWQRRGRAASVGDALLPCLPCWSRDRVVVSGGGGHGSWSWPCLATSWWRVRAQRLVREARACSWWWRGTWPVCVRVGHTRDASGVQGVCGRASSGQCRAPPRPGLC
jgi:hypothetical protein